MSYVVAYSSQLIDIFWVARLNPGAPTAVAFVATVFAVALTLNEVVGVSSVAVISRAKGVGDTAATALVVLQTLVLKLALGIVMVLLFWGFLKYGLPGYQLEATTLAYIREYASVIWMSLILVPLNATLLTTLRIFDQARLTAIISIVALSLNALLTPLLIFGVLKFGGQFGGFGLVGAAWSSILVEALVFLVAYLKLRSTVADGAFHFSRLRFDAGLYKDLLLIGLPVAGVVLMLNIEQMFITAIVVQQPVAVSDGFGIGQRLFGLLFISTMGVSLGIAVVAGEAIGRGDQQVITRETPQVLKRILMFSCVVLAMVFLWVQPLMSVFASHPETVAAGAVYLRFMAVAMAFYIIYSVFSGVFEGAGKNLPLLAAASVVYLCFEFPLLWMIARHPQPQLLWVWIVVLISIALLAAILGWMFSRRYWTVRGNGQPAMG